MASPHVRQWVDLLSREWPIEVYGINEGPSLLTRSARVNFHSPIKWIFKKTPKIIQYAVLGVWMRFATNETNFIHAHNTSGYGLAALLSGRSYIITTYGTEIFSAPKRSIAYRAFIRTVLRKATAITATSGHMRQVLIDSFGVEECKVFNFSLGVSSIFVDSPPRVRRGSAPVWFCNRRMHPLYNTLLVVDAFEEYQKHQALGTLLLLAGDADEDYKEKILKRVIGNPRITFLDQFLGQEEIIELLDSAHYTISIPESDQLSSSILEGAARGAIPIVRGLESYKSISDIAISLPVDLSVADLTKIFFETANVCGIWRERSEELKRVIGTRFSRERMLEEYRNMLNLINA
ncbi:glycosyltransferase [Variovorax paradoxus]